MSIANIYFIIHNKTNSYLFYLLIGPFFFVFKLNVLLIFLAILQKTCWCLVLCLHNICFFFIHFIKHFYKIHIKSVNFFRWGPFPRFLNYTTLTTNHNSAFLPRHCLSYIVFNYIYDRRKRICYYIHNIWLILILIRMC